MICSVPEGPVDGPGGGPVVPSHPALNARPFRFRGSAIAVDDFESIVHRFNQLTDVSISLDQRLQRRTALREMAKKVELPIVDLFVRRTSQLAAQLDPARWFIIGFGELGTMSRSTPALVGAPENDGGRTRSYSLAYLARPTRDLEVRLRDIFSLAHVPDASGWEDPDGEPGPETPPFHPTGGDSLFLAVEAELTAAQRRVRRLMAEEDELIVDDEEEPAAIQIEAEY